MPTTNVMLIHYFQVYLLCNGLLRMHAVNDRVASKFEFEILVGMDLFPLGVEGSDSKFFTYSRPVRSWWRDCNYYMLLSAGRKRQARNVNIISRLDCDVD